MDLGYAGAFEFARDGHSQLSFQRKHSSIDDHDPTSHIVPWTIAIGLGSGIVKSLLIVAYYFPPVAASGAMRALGFCRYLEKYGWRPWVLTTAPYSVYPPHPIDQELLARLPDNVAVETIPYINPLHRIIAVRNRLRELARAGMMFQNLQRQGGCSSSDPAKPQPRGRISRLRDLFLDWAFSFPDPQCSWLRPAVGWFSKLEREKFPQAVFATGGPWTSLLIGRTLSMRFQVPFIADYRDPWTSNPYSSFSSPFLVNKAKRLERSICTAASRVITNTDELLLKLCADYPELRNKCLTIPNGFDRESFVPEHEAGGMSDQLRSVDSNGRNIELCHFGTIYGKRTPVTLFQAMLELYEEEQLRADQVRMRFVGAWEVTDAPTERLAQELEKHGFLRREAPVAHQACLRQMARASALLIIQPDSPLQIPGKNYEYIATGRPLLLIGEEGATARLVRQHRLGISCPNGIADIKQLIRQLVNGQLELKSPPPECTDRFDYRTLTSDLAKALNDVWSEHSIEHSSNTARQ